MQRTKRFGLLDLVVLVGTMALAPMVASGDEERPSQRAWMRANGTNPGEWALRQKFKSDGVTPRSLTHGDRSDPTDAMEEAGKGVDCQAGCHYPVWEAARIQEVTQAGFTNVFGPTEFKMVGSNNPGTLLLDPNNNTKHKELFMAEGCGGCHSPKAAFDRGAVNEAGLADLKGCKNCHDFKGGPTANPETNMHTLHTALLTAETFVANPEKAGSTACIYCHASQDAVNGKGTCWNCHLSGHWPQVPYWKATPPIPAP